MNILAIDTSCDDTSTSVIKDGMVFSNIVSSQISSHKEWGGIVPDIARRMHKEKIDKVIEIALKRANININEIDYFAVTQGPGLAIALEVGIQKGIELAKKYAKPLIPINHMEGHIYSAFAKNSKGKINIKEINFPYLILLVSGKHTELIIMKDHFKYEKLGEQLDDAVGEAFDKVGRMIGLGYPGGPVLAKFAKVGDENKYEFPIPLKNSRGYNFSYSGLKTAVSRTISDKKIDKQMVYDISASFQKAAIGELIIKVNNALDEYENLNGIIVGGGVSANLYLRKKLREICREYNIPLYLPLDMKLCMDNAAMIGTCAYWRIVTNNLPKIDIEKIERIPRLSIN